jgi:beta-keto acid cleavage enzyme
VPMNTMAIALGLHVRVGIEDTLFGPDGERATSVQQIEKMVRIARELNRDIASGDDARRIYQIGTQWGCADETLTHLGMAPNRAPAGNSRAPRKAV